MEVFICKTGVYKLGGYPELTCHKKHAGTTLPDMRPCGFTTETYEESLIHAEETGHWIESHEDGREGNPIMREMHSSDYGGVYVQDYR